VVQPTKIATILAYKR